jgi:ribose 5-phosphate isomerase B
MNIVIASDQAGVKQKAEIIQYLKSKNHNVSNMGVNSEDSVDYPDVARKACQEYLNGDYDFGILLCGTGIGVSISANKINGIRCALIHDNYTAQMAKAHNNANFIAFGGRLTYSIPLTEMIETYMKTNFGGGRHQRRVDKIMDMEKN